MPGIKKIIPFICAFAILFLSVPPAQASGSYTGSTSYWDQLLLGMVHGTSSIPVLGDALQGIAGGLAGGVCSSSSDGLHHTSAISDDKIYEDSTGYFSFGTCTYCGDRFKVYGGDLESAYETQVAELANTTVRSGDSLRCYPTSYVNRVLVSSLSEIEQEPFYDASRQYFFSDQYTFVQKTSTGTYLRDPVWFYFQVPVTGYYYFSFPVNTYVLTSSLFIVVFSWGGEDVYYRVNSCNIDDSSVVTSSTSIYFDSDVVYALCAYPYPEPVKDQVCTHVATMSLVPDYDQFTGIVVDSSDMSSRPTSITGDYGIIGDNGQITKVDTTTIVNETNNTYTNPSTGTTSTITDWTYDYSDRSYELTLEGGDTVTVTYGDENVTIQEGDTVYSVYYIVEGTGGDSGVQPTPTPGPETCQHSYTPTVDREATCTVPGQTTYTCSLCGHTYTEAIPAKGHTWTVVQTVTTEYDQEGNLLQQGYTLYQCTVCQEQYKDVEGTGPPDSGGDDGESIWDKLGDLFGTVFGGILGLFEAVIGAVLDALTSLATMISEKLAAVVELVLSMFAEIPALFTGFLGFLTAVFVYIPEDIMLLLTFGIAVVVVIGIIKALRR